MKRTVPALAALLLALPAVSGQAFAGGLVFELPSLTFPADPASTRSCVTHTTPTPAPRCGKAG